MAFATFANGPYTVTYNGLSLGLLEGQPKCISVPHAIDVRSSRWGNSVIDGIQDGADVFVSLMLKEWTAAIRAALWPFSANLGDAGVPGRLLSDLGAALVFTAVTGTPAATNGPVTRTFAAACLAPEHNLEVMLGNEERNIPLIFRAYPAVFGTNLRHFADT